MPIEASWEAYTPSAGGGGGYNELLHAQGQSNVLSSGVSSVPSEVAAIDSARVKIWTGSAFEGYEAGTNSEPTGAVSTKWGPEAQYAIRWLADHPTGTLYIVKRAVSGTAISTWLDGQTNFDNAEAWAVAAKAAIAAAGVTLNAENILWGQGESDAIVDQALADAYQAKLVTFLSDARSKWAAASTKVALMRIYDANMTYRSTVRAAQNAVCYSDANTFMVNTDDLTLVDTYHYNNAGVIAIGDRMYDALTTGIGYEYESAKSLPDLTSASTPSGYAAAASSSFNATFAGWKAFDGSLDASTGRWATAVPAPGNAATLTFQTPTPVKVGAFTYKIYSSGATAAPGTLVLEGSNDGSNWTQLFSASGLSWTDNEVKMFEIPIAQREAFSQYKWSHAASSSNAFSALEITPLLAVG